MDIPHNPLTGEVLEQPDKDKSVYVPGAKIQANVTNLARLDLTGLQFRVLFALFSKVRDREGNVAYTHISEIADALGKSKQSIDRIISQLRAKGIVERDRNGIWVINARLGFRGTYWQWARVYTTSPQPYYEIDSNGLDGRKDPVEYNRTRHATEDPADV